LTKRDLAASVRERLLNRARAQDRPFQELLQYYAMERFLYRLSQSRQAEKFILKGALLLTAWRAPLSRSTMDIDLLGRTSHELEHVRAVFAQLCDLESEPDGIEYDAKSLKVTRIKEDADYEGVRVGQARYRLDATASPDSVSADHLPVDFQCHHQTICRSARPNGHDCRYDCGHCNGLSVCSFALDRTCRTINRCYDRQLDERCTGAYGIEFANPAANREQQ
jgi:hypothetical protein